MEVCSYVLFDEEKGVRKGKMSHIHFEKANLSHKDVIFEWLEEPHMKEFWDNSQEHKDDILNFIQGRKQHYFYGTTMYWMGYCDNQPFCFLLSDEVLADQDDLTELQRVYLSKTGKTIALDFGIGNKDFLGKGLAAPTLVAFTEFYQEKIDPKADIFFIDPDENNPRAKHVYEKAGFKVIGKAIPQKGYFVGNEGFIMVKKLPLKPRLVPATLADYPLLQNMVAFYEYEMSPYCDFSPDWLKSYFEETDRHAFIIKVGQENAGFALINKVGTTPDIDWNVGEFFILAKFQGQSTGLQSALQILDQFSGIWEITVIPENKGALSFWRKVLTRYTGGHFSEEIKMVDYDPYNPKRIIFRFNSEEKFEEVPSAHIRRATTADVSSMVALSDKKRSAYEQAQPQFWRRAEKANEEQAQWFEWLLSKDIHILLVVEMNGQIAGFIMGKLKSAPEVYDPGGLTLMIDDFCVESPELWRTVGRQLFSELQQQAKERGAVQTLVVCGHHDESKRQFLKREGLMLTSEWYVKEIS